MSTAVLPASVRRRAVFQLWLANLALGTIVGLNYLAHVPEAQGLKVWLFALPALVSSVLTLTLVPAGLFTLAAHCLRQVGLLGTVQAAFWTLFQILLAVVASTVIVLILIGITYYRLPWRKLPDPGPPQAEPAPRIVEPAIPAPQPAKPGAYAESP